MSAFDTVVQISRIARLMAGDMFGRKLPAYLVILLILSLVSAWLIAAFIIGGSLTLFMVLSDHGTPRDIAAPVVLLCLALATGLAVYATRHMLLKTKRAMFHSSVSNIQNITSAFMAGLNGRR